MITTNLDRKCYQDFIMTNYLHGLEKTTCTIYCCVRIRTELVREGIKYICPNRKAKFDHLVMMCHTNTAHFPLAVSTATSIQCHTPLYIISIWSVQ